MHRPQHCKNRPVPFEGGMSCIATKPGFSFWATICKTVCPILAVRGAGAPLPVFSPVHSLPHLFCFFSLPIFPFSFALPIFLLLSIPFPFLPE